MNEFGRRCERLLSVAIAIVFVGAWIFITTHDDGLDESLLAAIVFALVGVAWFIAARLVWRAFWRGVEMRFVPADCAACAMSIAVALLPAERREWGLAMSAELDHIDERKERRRFAFGCLRAALLMPFEHRSRVALTASLVVVLLCATWIGAERSMPASRVFLATFVTLVGIIALLAIHRAGGWRRSRSQVQRSTFNVFSDGAATDTNDSIPSSTGTANAQRLLVGMTFAGAVFACFVIVWWFIAKNMSVRTMSSSHFSPSVALTFAAALAGCAWFAAAPPRLVTVHPRANAIGALGALLFVSAFVATTAMLRMNAGPFVFVFLGPQISFVLIAAIAARNERSFRAGVEAAVWCAVLSVAFTTGAWLPVSLLSYPVDAHPHVGGLDSHAVRESLREVLTVLLAIPMFGLPFGVIGAALGRRIFASRSIER